MSPLSEDVLCRLKRQRPGNGAVGWSALMFLLLPAGSWWFGDFGVASILAPRRLANLERFFREVRPFPLQSTPFDWETFVAWLSDLMAERGGEAMVTTLAISVAAIFLAGLAGILLSVLAARTLSSPAPFLPSLRGSDRLLVRPVWALLSFFCRFVMIFLRAIPEYIWAFLLLAIFGPASWALVLALALHNLGILGRLGAEVVENTESAPLAALRALGARRLQIVVAGVFRPVFPRFLLFFLYRWETCLREATVLGMLGISSLGFWIQDARARNHYDEMFLFVVLGGVLVVLGDVFSALAREWLRGREG